MEPPSIDTIYEAISALYDNPNANEKEKASIWLGDVQKSIHSWKIADELLQRNKDVQSCYFAAQTMRSKVQHNLSELPSESLLSLRDSLITHLERTSPDTTTSILTQLSLALADLALQMTTWPNCISDLIKSFSHKNNYALLEILTVLPQEIDSSTLKLGENRRSEIKKELRDNSNIVISFLKESITSSNDTLIALRIIKCMTSWIQVEAINLDEIPQNAVIGYCLQVLRDYNSSNTLHDAASDCICALMQCIAENNVNDSVQQLLFESIASLEESYHMAVALEEDEKATNYARVFTELAESFLEKIVNSASNSGSHFALRSLELALICVGHHDYEVAEITFNLWYRLSETVYQRNQEPLSDTFQPHMKRLIEALARHCQCEPDHTQLPEEGNEFYEFRNKVMELIKDVVFIVGSSTVFREMFATLQADLPWEQTEAALFVMQAVAKGVIPEENYSVPKVVEAILGMPDTAHLAVRKTCIFLLGELCDWIEQHPECLEPCLHFLIKALHDKQLAYAAAVALQNICVSCGSGAAQHAATLLRAASLSEALALEPREAAALLRAVAAAISRLPPAQLSEAMCEAVAMQVRGLTALMEGANRNEPDSDPCVWVDRIAALFRRVEVAPPPTPDVPAAELHPCLPALALAWPALRDALAAYGAESRIMERTCRALRFALRCCGRSAAPLLPALATALTSLYATHHHSCVLYLASVATDELAVVPACREQLVRLLAELLPRAFRLLQRPLGLRDNPDTVDDLFRLCTRCLQRVSVNFLSSAAAGAVCECAALAARLDHRDANASVMKFIQELARAANLSHSDTAREEARSLAEGLLSRYGANLTYAIIESTALHLHPYMVADAAEALLEVLRWQRSTRADWVAEALRRLPTDRPAAPTPIQCHNFHQMLIKAESYKEVSRLLRDFARLFR